MWLSSNSATAMLTRRPSMDVNSVAEKLRGFADLRAGWNFGEGVPVAQSAVRVTEGLLKWASQLTLQVDVFPGLDGECMVSFYGGDDCVRVIVTPDQSEVFGLRVERGRGAQLTDVIEPTDTATRHEVYRRVAGLVEKDSWISLASYTSESYTILVNCALSNLHSRTRAGTALAADHPFSIRGVPAS